MHIVSHYIVFHRYIYTGCLKKMLNLVKLEFFWGTQYIHIYSSDMIYCSSGIFLLAQTWSLNVKLILAIMARMTIIGICAFPFFVYMYCACMHVLCKSTCVIQLYRSVLYTFVCCRQTAVLHWLVNGRVLDPGKEGEQEKRVTASQRIAGYLFQVCDWFHGRMQLPLCDLKRKHECSQFNFSFFRASSKCEDWVWGIQVNCVEVNFLKVNFFSSFRQLQLSALLHHTWHGGYTHNHR